MASKPDWTLRQLADACNVSTQWIGRLIKQRGIPHRYITKRLIVVPFSDGRKLIRSMSAASTDAATGASPAFKLPPPRENEMSNDKGETLTNLIAIQNELHAKYMEVANEYANREPSTDQQGFTEEILTLGRLRGMLACRELIHEHMQRLTEAREVELASWGSDAQQSKADSNGGANNAQA